jgi:hypothetical protein
LKETINNKISGEYNGCHCCKTISLQIILNNTQACALKMIHFCVEMLVAEVLFDNAHIAGSLSETDFGKITSLKAE